MLRVSLHLGAVSGCAPAFSNEENFSLREFNQVIKEKAKGDENG